MAVGKEVECQLNRTFYLLGKLQDQINVMATNVVTLGTKVGISKEVDKNPAQESFPTEQIEESEKEESAVIKVMQGGAVTLQRQMVDYNLRPYMMATRRSQFLEMEARLGLENERWRGHPMWRSNDFWDTNLSQAEAGVFRAFGFERSVKQDLEYPIGPTSNYGSLAYLLRRNMTTDGLELHRDLFFNTKDYQKDRQRGHERDLRASDLRSPG